MKKFSTIRSKAFMIVQRYNRSPFDRLRPLYGQQSSETVMERSETVKNGLKRLKKSRSRFKNERLYYFTLLFNIFNTASGTLTLTETLFFNLSTNNGWLNFYFFWDPMITNRDISKYFKPFRFHYQYFNNKLL